MKPLTMKYEPLNRLFSRRHFILILWGAWVALLMSLLKYLQAPQYVAKSQYVVLGPPDQFQPGLTALPLYQAWLIREPTGFFALRAVCPHLGCPPNWDSDSQKFICPCHNSQFDAKGHLKQGPALRALERYEIFLTAKGSLALNLDKTYLLEKGEWKSNLSFVNWPKSRI
jgi:nitrite reductase/ring-hydroxylating ferredoxin subunit